MNRPALAARPRPGVARRLCARRRAVVWAAARLVLAAALCSPLVPAAEGASQARLLVLNASASDQADAPVTTGVPWPRGALRSAQELRLCDANAEEIPLQVAVISRWPDASPKWTVLDFQATAKANRNATYWLEYGPGVRRKKQSAKAVLVEEDADHITVSTGAAVMKVRRRGFNVLDQVRLRHQDQPVVRAADNADGLRLVPTEELASAKSPGHSTFVQLPATDKVFLGRHPHGGEWFRTRGFRVLDPATGKEMDIQIVGASLDPAGKQNVVGHGWCEGVFLHLGRVPQRHVEVEYPRAAASPPTFYSRLGPSQVAVEARGPVRAVVRATGKFQSTDGATLCDYVARLHFYAGQATARLQLTVLNRQKTAWPPAPRGPARPQPLSRGLATYPLLLNDLSLRVPLRLRGLKRFAFSGNRRLGATHQGEFHDVEEHAELVQFAGRFARLARYTATHGDKEIAAGTMSAGAVGLRDAVQGAVVAVRRLWANNPKALRAAGRAHLEAGLFPREANPCEGLLAGRAKTHDILLAFHGEQPADLLGTTDGLDTPLVVIAAPPGGQRPTGSWYADTGALPLHPLGTSDHDLLFADDYRALLASREATGSYGTWHYGAQGRLPCRLLRLVIDHATHSTLRATALLGTKGTEGLALRMTSGAARAAGRTDPLIVAASNPREGTVSFVKSLHPVPQKGSRGVLYAPHGAFLCHRFDPAYALAREHLRQGNPRPLWAAHAVSLHLADINTFHNIHGASPQWTGACHDSTLGQTAHHAPGLSPEASWYAGAWLTFLLTDDRAVLRSALDNATFAARHADDPDTSALAAALATINLCFATDVAPTLAPEQAPVFQAALETYVDKLLAAQRHTRHGLYGEQSIPAALALQALSLYQQRHPDDRIAPSMVRAAEALIRPDRCWSGHDKVGRLRDGGGAPVKPYATADGVVADYARNPDHAIHGPACALVAPYLAAVGQATGDTKYIKKARRLERVAALFRCGTAMDFALRYRSGDLFAVAWQRYLEQHPPATDDAIAFQCRLENAADVAMPDLGAGGSVLFRPFVAQPDGSRALQAQAPGAVDRPGLGAWFPLLGSGNVAADQGALEFRICYRKGPGRRENPWVLSGDPQTHGFALGLKGDSLELVSRYRRRLAIRIVHRGPALKPGSWHHVAFTWRPAWGTDLFLDGRKVGHSPQHRIGLARRLRLPCYPDDQTNEYLIDDLRIWKTPPKDFAAAVADRTPPAAVADLRLEPAADGKALLSWTAPGDDDKGGRARRYDIRITTQRLGPISWGGYARSADPVGAIHWAEADRIAPAPKPQPAGRLEKLLIGPLPRRRRVYIALKTEDEANVSPLSNIVTNAVNHPPVADPGPAVRQIVTGSTVAFDATGSSDPDYDDLSYQWSNGIQAATGTVRYDKPGTHNVVLTVSDGKAKARATSRLLVGPAIRVSFQAARAKVPEGFVADTGAVYAKGRGYGWRLLPAGVRAFERKTPAALPAEARTGLHLPVGAQWLLDLPNGRYHLTIAVGDPADLAGRRRVFVEGKELFNVELTGSAKPYVATRQPIRVADGQLNLHVGVPATPAQPSPEGGEINYLVIEQAK